MIMSVVSLRLNEKEEKVLKEFSEQGKQELKGNFKSFWRYRPGNYKKSHLFKCRS